MRYVRQMRHLSVLVGEQMACGGHVEQLEVRVKGHFYKLASIARTKCGYTNHGEDP